MRIENVAFDENHCVEEVQIDGQASVVTLTISDALDAAHDALRREYKKRIADFVNSSSQWLPMARQKIVSDVRNENGLKLMEIFVLFEQDAEKSLFGLLFNLDFDREHGKGMMLDGESFDIVKYGEGSVAFEG
jgi:predicted ATP-dependent endonuclease of OLD family